MRPKTRSATTRRRAATPITPASHGRSRRPRRAARRRATGPGPAPRRGRGWRSTRPASRGSGGRRSCRRRRRGSPPQIAAIRSCASAAGRSAVPRSSGASSVYWTSAGSIASGPPWEPLRSPARTPRAIAIPMIAGRVGADRVDRARHRPALRGSARRGPEPDRRRDPTDVDAVERPPSRRATRRSGAAASAGNRPSAPSAAVAHRPIIGRVSPATPYGPQGRARAARPAAKLLGFCEELRQRGSRGRDFGDPRRLRRPGAGPLDHPRRLPRGAGGDDRQVPGRPPRLRADLRPLLLPRHRGRGGRPRRSPRTTRSGAPARARRRGRPDRHRRAARADPRSDARGRRGQAARPGAAGDRRLRPGRGLGRGRRRRPADPPHPRPDHRPAAGRRRRGADCRRSTASSSTASSATCGASSNAT